MDISLKEKVVVITGAQRGIGKGIALKMAECGADLCLVDLKISEEDEVVREAKEFGVKVIPISADISDAAKVTEAFAQIKETFGKVDVLVNNAGITKDGMSKKMTLENFKKVLDVNLVGSFLCAQQAYLLMKEAGVKGSIINFSSVAGFKGNIGQANYSASKAGVFGMTKTMALEYARDGIRVNAIAPGFIATPMTDAIPEEIKKGIISRIPLLRQGQPSDIANSVLFLATDLSSYITGQVLHINGGSFTA